MRPRVLVARLDSLGDVLLAGPAVRAIAEHARVIMLCGSRGADAARLLPGVSEVIVWDAPWIADPPPPPVPSRFDALVEQVTSARVSSAVILTSFHQSPLPLALLLRTAGVAHITGASVDYAGSLLDVRLRPGEDFSEDLPEPERALGIAAAAGFESRDDGRLRLRTVPDTTDLTGTEPYTVLHPGASVPARQWTIEGFTGTARLLRERGRRVVLTGGRGERPMTQAIAREVAGVVDLAGACDLPRLAGVLAGADAVVVGNTGPAHVAAAVGTPVVSLFSPVVPAVRWAPYRVPHRLLGDQFAPCRDSRARECPIAGHPCLAGVTPEQVLGALDELEHETDAAYARPDLMGALE